MNKRNGVIQELLQAQGIVNSDYTINESKIKPILFKLKKGLKQYLSIQRGVNVTNVAEDILFQEMFSNFYRIDPFRNEDWKKQFYILFEDSKKGNVSFKNVLKVLYDRTKGFEASFASKLVATINPNMPVIDKVVLVNLSLYKKYQEISKLDDLPTRINKTDVLYQNLLSDFNKFIKSKSGRNIVKRFNEEYPYVQVTERIRITEVKILDLILWQLRR